MDLGQLARQVAIEDGNKGGIVIAVQDDALEIAFNGLTRSEFLEALQMVIRQAAGGGQNWRDYETREPNGRVH